MHRSTIGSHFLTVRSILQISYHTMLSFRAFPVPWLPSWWHPMESVIGILELQQLRGPQTFPWHHACHRQWLVLLLIYYSRTVLFSLGCRSRWLCSEMRVATASLISLLMVLSIVTFDNSFRMLIYYSRTVLFSLGGRSGWLCSEMRVARACLISLLMVLSIVTFDNSFRTFIYYSRTILAGEDNLPIDKRMWIVKVKVKPMRS